MRLVRVLASAATFVVASTPAAAQSSGSTLSAVRLDSTTKLNLVNARALWVDYRGRRALNLAPREGHEKDTDQELMAVLEGSDFADGVIEVDVAGARRQGYATDDASAFKGFIGISFRVRGDSAERIYLRTENSRLPNQLFRNRSTQYESSPDYPWQRLRQESPGQYESYVDLEPGAWTTLRIEVSGVTARLYVNGASQPVLIVNDLKLGRSHGAIALWTRISADAYFSNLRVTSGAPPARSDATTSRLQPTGALPRVASVLNGHAEQVTYRGARAVKLVPAAETEGKDMDMLAILDGPDFKDGTIQLEVAGAPRPGTPPDSRGFIGLSFRTGAQGEWSEVIYLRPTNGRANDQVRRNHSTQYVSHPDFTWQRLRQESPGLYESYADLEAGAWTTMRVEVSGVTARLYVNGAEQPSLVINDLKHGSGAGRIALWAHVETDAYFGPISVTAR